MRALVGRRPSHFLLSGLGYGRSGPAVDRPELNFVRASFDLMFGSSPHPELIKGTNMAHFEDSMYHQGQSWRDR